LKDFGRLFMDFTPEKILLIQFRQIGDVLLSAPAAEVLKANFPGAKIDFLTQAPSNQALERNPAIDEVLIYENGKPLKWLFEIRRRRYDLVIDLMSNPRSAFVTAISGARIKAGPAYTYSAWAYNLKLKLGSGQREYNPFFKIDLLSQLGLTRVFYPYPKCYPADEDLAWAQAAARDLRKADDHRPSGGGTKDEDRKLIAFSPASRRITRQWPAEHYARLAALVVQKTKAAVLVLWGPGEKALAESIVRMAAEPGVMLSPETATLSKLSALLKQTELLVANCNGAKHIAQASGIPTLGVYGSSRPESWTPPDDPQHQVVRNYGLACIACQKSDCAQALKCLKELAPETVFAKLEHMLGRAALK